METYMRILAKPNAKLGLYKGEQYRRSLFNPCSDLEAMLDAYGINAIMMYATLINDELIAHGDCTRNAAFALEMNTLPMPTIRKQHKKRSTHK
jgi:hypothetical protein